MAKWADVHTPARRDRGWSYYHTQRGLRDRFEARLAWIAIAAMVVVAGIGIWMASTLIEWKP